MRGPSKQEFRGLRFIGKDQHDGCIPCGVKGGDNKVHWCGTKVGAGANSGFQALNLAAACGAKRIILTGYDMSRTNGVHWHGEHQNGMNNPSDRMLAGCANILDGVAKDYSAHGVEVINASRETALRAYKQVPIQEALACRAMTTQ